MDSIRDYINVVLEPWQVAQRAESVAQALALIEQKFGIVFRHVDFEVLDNEDYYPYEDESPTDPSKDGEEE